MKATYYDIWTKFDDIDYRDVFAEDELIYAGYSYEDYSGDALVVFARDGVLYENNDGHCSCNGLEHWNPEVTSARALMMRAHWPGLKEALVANGFAEPVAE